MITKKLLDRSEERCIAAVVHVGKANYAEREGKALSLVGRVFDKLREEVTNGSMES